MKTSFEILDQFLFNIGVHRALTKLQPTIDSYKLLIINIYKFLAKLVEIFVSDFDYIKVLTSLEMNLAEVLSPDEWQEVKDLLMSPIIRTIIAKRVDFAKALKKTGMELQKDLNEIDMKTGNTEEFVQMIIAGEKLKPHKTDESKVREEFQKENYVKQT